MLDIEPAREAIRQVFIDRIVHAKGIDRAAARFDRVLMPTPAAVLEGARLLADGCGGMRRARRACSSSTPAAPRPTCIRWRGRALERRRDPAGLPEPRVKRTVEGDLGMRHNAARHRRAVGLDAIGDRRGSGPGRGALHALVAEIAARRRLSAANGRGSRPRRGAGVRRRAPCGASGTRHGGDRLHRAPAPSAVQHRQGPDRGATRHRHRRCAGAQPGSPPGAADGARRYRDAPVPAADERRLLLDRTTCSMPAACSAVEPQSWRFKLALANLEARGQGGRR